MSVTNEGGIERGIYIEVQLGAFPEYDLEVFFTSDNEQLLANLEQVQQVTLADVEPFLFLEESDADGDLFADSSDSSGTGRPGDMHATITS